MNIFAQNTHYDANTGITIWAPNYHSITPNNGVFIILRSDQYASMGGVSMVWPFKSATVEQLKNALSSPMRYDGFNMSAVSNMETINGTQWGGYVSGVVQGSAVYGYMTAVSDPASGKGAVWLHYYSDANSKKLAREAAIERTQQLQFDRPSVAATPASNKPQQGGKVVENHKICTHCVGQGSNQCYSCLGKGSKSTTEYRYTSGGMVMETKNTTCYLCSGTGKIKCTFCVGTGTLKSWEYKKE